MRIISENNNVIIKNIKDFTLSQTLECGQCFRYDKISDEEYIIVAFNRMLHINQEKDSLIFHNTTEEEYENVWKQYFDIERDYGKIKEILKKNDENMTKAIALQGGIRILNQEFRETLISFIISQNQQIVRIRQIIAVLCEKYGEPVGEYKGKTYYSFPDTDVLADIPEEGYRECKAGFRAKYLFEAAKILKSGELDEKKLRQMTREEAGLKLTALKGVGKKVSDCTLLFGLGFREAFPVDVWVKRIMEELYFNKDVKKEQIQKFAGEKFGKYGGYAQQYLFAYARENADKKSKTQK